MSWEKWVGGIGGGLAGYGTAGIPGAILGAKAGWDIGKKVPEKGLGGAISEWWSPSPEVVKDPYAGFIQENAQSGMQAGRESWQNFIGQGTQGVDNVAYNPWAAADFNQRGFMDNWQQDQGYLMNLAVGASSPYGQALNQVAQRNAQLGGEAALQAMPGARNSGAGMAAFGQAYADPFAQAQVAQQQMQSNMFGALSGQAMGQYGQNAQFGANLEQQANLTNAQLQAQYDMQNQMMQNALRDRQMQAANMGQAYDLGWGNIGAGLASDFSYKYTPSGARDGFNDAVSGLNTAIKLGSMAQG